MKIYLLAYKDNVGNGYQHRVVATVRNVTCSHYIWKSTPTLTQEELSEAIREIKLTLIIW